MKNDFIYTELVNISDDYIQEHTLLIGSDIIFIKIYYYEAVGGWFIDLSVNDKRINGVRITAGIEHLKFYNDFDYDFLLTEVDESPTLLTDLKKCKINFYEKVQ